MTEPSAHTAVGADAAQAGALLRAARQQQGLHIAALAASIKVAPAKLEALESGRTHELPDATFTRALALTVCRVLKIDAAPVLALLPGAPAGSLERVDSGLNTPFRERAGRGDPAGWLPWRHPVLWLAGLLLAAAAAFVLVPSQPGQLPALESATAPVMPPSGAGGPTPIPEAAPAPTPAPAPAEGASAGTGVLGAVAPRADAAASAAAPASSTTAQAALAPVPSASQAAADAALVLRAVQSTWVQAVDGGGQTLMARLVPAGETVALTPALPVRLRIGNARGTELQFRGQPVDLATAARDNIANITLP
jgi:cytoskeleton protein RodZ